jgi:hypothetical protein
MPTIATWLTILVSCPAPGRADQRAHLGVDVEHRERPVVVGLLAAAHDAQLAIDRARLAARDRRIDEADAESFCFFEQFSGQHRGGGGVIHQDRALFQSCQRAAVAVGNRAHVVVVSDAHQDEVLVLSGLFGSRSGLAAVLLHPLCRLGGGAVVDGHFVATLFQQVAGHRVTHDAEAKKCDFRHLLVS